MEKKTIASFSVDHRGMQPGVYFREDIRAGVPVLTADVRFYEPNRGRYLSTTEAHTIEHLLATYLRSCPSGFHPCSSLDPRWYRVRSQAPRLLLHPEQEG